MHCSSSRSAYTDREFRAIHQIEIVAALDEDRSSPDACTDCGANRPPLPPPATAPITAPIAAPMPVRVTVRPVCPLSS
jgi:hypothetical protein